MGKGFAGMGNQVMVEVGADILCLASELLAEEEGSDVWPTFSKCFRDKPYLPLMNCY